MHIAKHRWFIRLVTLLLFQTVTVSQAATLKAFARLAADSFTPGPTSGQFIEPINDRHPPFENKQPLQGFSAIIEGDHGSYIVLSDNGFGRRDNSSDYILSIYHIEVDFRTVDGGSGNVSVSNIIQLHDPDQLLPYAATREHDRLLTGADLDPESFRRDTDGSFWIGEEFNPSLVHFSEQGKMLAAPYKLEGLSSVDNPMGEPSTLPRSRGFEGMAISPDGKRLYPLLEGPLDDSGPGLNIYAFDLEKRQFTNSHAKQPSYRYRLDEDTTAIGDFTMFSSTSGLVIERDSGEGEKALSKKIYRIDFDKLDTDGYLSKTLVADLLHIEDPNDLNRDGLKMFTFPFWTIEGLVVLNRTTLGVVNDNNYPLGQGRDNSGSRPDDNEFILIEIEPLWD